MEVCDSSPKAKTFFDLPPELRDTIYAMILKSEIKPPPPESQTVEERKNACKKAYAVQPHHIASFGFLYANRQLRVEMSNAIARQSATEKGITYQLDFSEHLGVIIPTWTALPAPPCHLRNLSVTVHLASGNALNRSQISSLIDLVDQFFKREHVWWEKCNISPVVDTLEVHIPTRDPTATLGVIQRLRKRTNRLSAKVTWIVLSSYDGMKRIRVANDSWESGDTDFLILPH